MKRRDFLKVAGIAGLGYLLGLRLEGSQSLEDQKELPSTDTIDESVDQLNNVAPEIINNNEVAKEGLSIGVLLPKVDSYITEYAFNEQRNITSEILHDTDPYSTTNLTARMMLSEDDTDAVVATLIGYVAYNRLKNANTEKQLYSLTDVICGYGKHTFGKQDASRPFASDRDPFVYDIDSEKNGKKKIYPAEVFARGDELIVPTDEGHTSHKAMEQIKNLVRNDVSILYRVLAHMIHDPKQPLARLYDYGQTMFMHTETQAVLHEQGKVKSPADKENEFISKYGAIPLNIPLTSHLGGHAKDYIAFYAITNPKDPFAIGFDDLAKKAGSALDVTAVSRYIAST